MGVGIVGIRKSIAEYMSLKYKLAEPEREIAHLDEVMRESSDPEFVEKLNYRIGKLKEEIDHKKKRLLELSHQIEFAKQNMTAKIERHKMEIKLKQSELATMQEFLKSV